jgi:hypothetical protein
LAVRPPSVGRLEGAIDGGPYEVQWRAWRRPIPVHSNSVGDVVAVPGVALQWRGWSHRADNDGEDRSRRPDVTAWSCVVIEKAFAPIRGFRRTPSRARRVSRMKLGGTVPRGWHRPLRTVLYSDGDGLPQGVGGTAPGCDSQACQGRGAVLRCQSIKCSYVRAGMGASRARGPSSEADLARGGVHPSGEADLAQRGVQPCRSGGPWGSPGARYFSACVFRLVS